MERKLDLGNCVNRSKPLAACQPLCSFDSFHSSRRCPDWLERTLAIPAPSFSSFFPPLISSPGGGDSTTGRPSGKESLGFKREVRLQFPSRPAFPRVLGINLQLCSFQAGLGSLFGWHQHISPSIPEEGGLHERRHCLRSFLYPRPESVKPQLFGISPSLMMEKRGGGR